MAVLKRQNGHDCGRQQAHVLAVLLRVETVIQKAKKFLACPADVFREADGGPALLPVEAFNSASSLNYDAERDRFTPQLAFEV